MSIVFKNGRWHRWYTVREINMADGSRNRTSRKLSESFFPRFFSYALHLEIEAPSGERLVYERSRGDTAFKLIEDTRRR